MPHSASCRTARSSGRRARGFDTLCPDLSARKGSPRSPRRKEGMQGVKDNLEPALSDPLNEDLLEALLRSSRTTLAGVEQVLKEYGLCPTEFGVLEAVAALGPQPIQVLAARVLVTSGSMTYTVNQLRRKGLIARVCSREDARRWYLHLTPEGDLLIRRALRAHNQRVAHLFAPLPDRDKHELIRLLTPLFQPSEQRV